MTLLPPLLRKARLSAMCLAAALPFAAAHADDAKPRCLYVDMADLPIRYVGAGLMPAVDGVIDGTPATLLVDTGAFDTQLTKNGAAKRDLGLFMTGRHAEGFGGLSRLYSARLKEFGIGPVHSTRSLELLVLDEDNLTPAFDAIVGAPFLLQSDLEIDLRDKKMRFFRPRDCRDAPLLLWKEDTVVVPFEHHPDRSPNPHFSVLVNGQELDAMIDTGAHSTLMTLRAAKRAGIEIGGPGARRAGEVIGVGSERSAYWLAKVKSIQFGTETINNAEIGVVDSHGPDGTDLYLGQDFLRAHRVLFAMSQKKLYIAYLGGNAFVRSEGMPDWVRAEAEGGNPDAAYALALAYRNGRGVARDPAQAHAWLQKAAAGGEPHANISLGRQQMLSGHVAEAIPRLRAGLDLLPADRVAPLWLYIARVRNGEAVLAQTELQAGLKKQDNDSWPAPVAEFYLGKLDAPRLLGAAAKEEKFAHARTCMANNYMAEWHAARGEQEQANALKTVVRTQCAPAAAPAAQPAPAQASDADKRSS